ncbi:MAG: PTS sugar transporter subunit IIA [Elusimicrobiales bacterium]|nr:PTS sugar transporter subunit IIA [Elusimicrobiales bacterium]
MSNITLTSLMTPGSIFFLDDSLDSSYGKKEALSFLASHLKDEVPRDVASTELEELLQMSGDSQQLHASSLYLAFAKFPELRDIHSVLGISRKGFDNGGNSPVKAVLVSLVPRNSAFFQKHLDFLSSINSLFTDEFVSKIAEAADPQAVYEMLAS